MDNFTLRQLRYFDALAVHEHFGRAADACAVSQPALSIQIKELEDAFGSALFERMPRRVRLTATGQEFLTRTRLILQSVDDLGELSREAKGHLFGQLRLGVIPTIAPYLLPAVIDKVTKEFDGIDIHIRETTTSNLLRELSEGRIDTAIVALPISEATLTEVAILEENFVLVRPEKDHDQPVPNQEKLREMRLLLLEEGHCFRDQALAFCNIQSNLSRRTLDATSLSTLVQMVGAGLGVTLIPEMAVPVETGSAAVSVAAFDAPQPTRTIGMIWRKTSPQAQHFMRISDIVRTCADGLHLGSLKS